MSEWKPIESAPKDGTEILVCGGGEHDPMLGVANWARRDENDSPGWMMWWQPGFEKHDWPEFWMPIPNYPTS